MLAVLERVRGDKTVILISGGWPLDEREETSMMSTVAAEAAAARATFYTMFVPASTFSADRRAMSSAPASDQFLHSGPLETLAGMTGGGTFRAEVERGSARSIASGASCPATTGSASRRIRATSTARRAA